MARSSSSDSASRISTPSGDAAIEGSRSVAASNDWWKSVALHRVHRGSRAARLLLAGCCVWVAGVVGLAAARLAAAAAGCGWERQTMRGVHACSAAPMLNGLTVLDVQSEVDLTWGGNAMLPAC